LGIVAIFASLATVILLASELPTSTNSPTTTVAGTGGPGSTLAGINQPLNSTSLSVINNAPNAYFETAGEMYLNDTIQNPIFGYPSFGSNAHTVNGFVANNKTSVVYLGSITCIYCGENRWAMALALSRFGTFSQLFTGYSSFGDGDVPTLYWAAEPYNSSTDDVHNYYTSNYINFVSIEDINPITGGFKLNPLQTILSNLVSIGNKTDLSAFNYILNLSSNTTTAFAGTPYTIWGRYQFNGADAADFGNPNQSATATGLPYLSLMTHGQVLGELARPNDQFGWTEYAAADVYTAALCKSLNNTASVCTLPAIQGIEAKLT
jgi:hypothetical protein